jgi:pyrroloquinoline quinone biosynthesis protein B
VRVHVLGAAAGGGFPQWNCGCDNCVEVRGGSTRTEPRTQDSLAVTNDGEAYALINASPDILVQLQRTPALAPRMPRHSPIASIVLTNGDMDHVLGLFSLRESHPLCVYATEPVWRGLRERNALFRTFDRFEGQITWRPLTLGAEITLPGGLALTPFAVPGKLPVHLERDTTPSAEDNIGLQFSAGDARVIYCAAAGALGDYVSRFDRADCVFFDGTFATSDELVRLGLGKARAESMAHLPILGEGGSLARLAAITAARKIYTHINNSNPILLRGSEARARVEASGWEVAYDGMVVDA